MAGSERAVPILFSRLLKKFFSTAAASVDFYVTCVTHSGEAGSVLRGLKMASPVALLNKRSISVLLVLANCAPVRVVLFCLDVDDEVDGHNNLLYQLLSFIVKE
ncbi:von Willebrand factor [Trichinella pseudospiralis]